MKQFLLTGLMMAAVVGANATDVATESFSTQSVKKNVPAVSGPVSQKSQLIKRPISRPLPDIKVSTLPERAFKAKAKAMADETTDVAMFESFEAWPIEEFDLEWLPEGWTAQRQASVDDMESWFPFYQYNYAYPAPADGQYYYCIMYSEEEQDEWLITPEIEIAEGYELTYYLYYTPLYLFSDENLDWDTLQYDGDKIVAATFQVMVKAEGETEWTKLQDIADRFKDYDAYDLYMAQPEGLQKQNVKLSDYVGKKVQLGFRYVGSNGDAMFFDAVRVGIGMLEDVSYAFPAHTFYWGYDSNFTGLGSDVAQVPVYSPVTYINTSLEDATYEWSYLDPASRETATDDDQYELSLTYTPTYTEEGSQKFELLPTPTLTATAPGKAATDYQAPVYVHAGGTATYEEDGVTYDFSVFPFAKKNANVGGITVSDDQIGDMSIPVFGHSPNTNKYWYNFTANGDEDADETCYNHLLGIANLYMPEQGYELVVNGVQVFGYGLINPGAQLKFTIYALLQTEDGISTDPSDMTVVASKTITGADIIAADGDNSVKDYLCLPFNFDETAVVVATEEHPAFFFMLEGFNSDEVEYFMPLQTRESVQGAMSLGYMMSEINFQVVSGRPTYFSVKPLVYYEDYDYIHPESSFAFGLIAEYPWLTCETEEVSLGANDESVEVALESYYNDSRLTVEAPEGLTATVTGRYNDCKLTIARESDTTDEIVGDVTVKAPGVELTIAVKADKPSGVDSIINSDAVATEAYDLFGRRIDNPSTGVYIIKYNDGTVRKKVVVE